MEALVPRPSEVGKPTGLSFMPPLYFTGRSAMRRQVCYGVDDDAAYEDEHMAVQGGGEGVLDIGFWCLVVTRGQRLPLGRG